MSSYLSAEIPNELIANAERLGTARKIIIDACSGTPGAIQHLVKLLSTTPDAFQHISCILLDKETLGQKTDEGKLLVDVLKEGGVLIGTQVDMGLTEHPDDLAEYCQKLYEAGASFVKIYTKLEVDLDEQSQSVVDAYANWLARYAAIVQQNGLVPIVGPEILIDGPDNIYKSYAIDYCGVIERVLAACYKAFSDHRVLLEGTLLNPNAVIHGFEPLKVFSPLIAEATVRIFKRTVPAAVPVIILSHGKLGQKEPTFFDAVGKDNTRQPWAVASIVTLNPNRLMDFTVEEGEMKIFQAEFTRLCKEKAKAPVLMPEGFGAIVMSEGLDTVVGGVANFGMPGGGGAVTGASFVMPESFDTIEMPESFDNIEMPEAVDTSEMPGGGANSEMPAGGGPVPRGSQNLRPAEYIYEFNFGFNFHFFFSAIAH